MIDEQQEHRNYMAWLRRQYPGQGLGSGRYEIARRFGLSVWNACALSKAREIEALRAEIQRLKGQQ